MKVTRILPILFIAVPIIWFAWHMMFVPEGPDVGNLIATFSGGSITSSDVMVTDYFQVTDGGWLIAGKSPHILFGWRLEVEVYQEGVYDPVRSIRSTDYSVSTPEGSDFRYQWELSAGTTEGMVWDTWYNPDLPPCVYYLKIDWERCEWIIDILSIVES